MVRYANSWLLAGTLLVTTSACAQSRLNHVRLSPAHQQVRPAGAMRTQSAIHPLVVRLPAPPAMRGAHTSTNSQASTQDAVVSLTALNSISNGTSVDLGQFLGNGVPGLGFDFPHLAALNGNLGERAIVDPVTQHELALTEQLLHDEQGVPVSTFVPFSGEYSEPAIYEAPQQQQTPQIIVLQQPAAQGQSSSSQTAPAPAEKNEAQPPLPPVGEFILVLRSGKQIKAVAFTRQADAIVYVTADGTRGSFPATELDSSATEQLNQQHGTPLKLSI